MFRKKDKQFGILPTDEEIRAKPVTAFYGNHPLEDEADALFLWTINDGNEYNACVVSFWSDGIGALKALRDLANNLITHIEQDVDKRNKEKAEFIANNLTVEELREIISDKIGCD